MIQARWRKLIVGAGRVSARGAGDDDGSGFPRGPGCCGGAFDIFNV
jgi:hypothetical protein